jgi:hypothetical protein
MKLNGSPAPPPSPSSTEKRKTKWSSLPFPPQRSSSPAPPTRTSLRRCRRSTCHHRTRHRGRHHAITSPFSTSFTGTAPKLIVAPSADSECPRRLHRRSCRHRCRRRFTSPAPPATQSPSDSVAVRVSIAIDVISDIVIGSPRVKSSRLYDISRFGRRLRHCILERMNGVQIVVGQFSHNPNSLQPEPSPRLRGPSALIAWRIPLGAGAPPAVPPVVSTGACAGLIERLPRSERD